MKEKFNKLEKQLEDADKTITEIVVELERLGIDKAFLAKIKVLNCINWNNFHKARAMSKELFIYEG